MKKLTIGTTLLLLLTSCATTAGTQLNELEPVLKQSSAEYDTCVKKVNSAANMTAISSLVNMHNQPPQASKLLNDIFFSADEIDAVVPYNISEFDCFAKGMQSVSEIDQLRVSNLIQAYAEKLSEAHTLMQDNTKAITIGS